MAQDAMKPNTEGQWYSTKIVQPRCCVCGIVAKVKVYNSANAHVGDFCRGHGKKVVRARSTRIL